MKKKRTHGGHGGLGYAQKLKLLFSEPGVFFARIGTDPSDSFKLFLATAVAVQLLIVLVSAGNPSAAWLGFVAIAASLVWLLVSSAISQSVGRTFLKASGSYLDTLGVLLYVGAARNLLDFGVGILVAMGIVGPQSLAYLAMMVVLVLLYMLYLAAVGLSTVHKISTPKALMMVLAPIALMVLLMTISQMG